MRGHEIMRVTKQLIEAQGYQVIYGDTDSTFVWLREAHTDEQALKLVICCVIMSTNGGNNI
ncbi:DNA polymerase II [Providencia rustigianii]|nr:DNA polymerase II [Providencia rustigianii]